MKVLVIKPSSLGDVIHALRVISLLVKEKPNLQIHWVIKKGLEGIIDASGLVKKYYFFHRGGGWYKYLNLGRELRKERYDFVLDMQGLLRSAVLSRLANGKKTFGCADGREFSTFFYQPVGERSRKSKIHAIEKLLPFLDLFDVNKNDALSLEFPKSEQLSTFELQPYKSSKNILIFPESRRQEKVWPGFESLTKIINESSKASIWVGGSNKDQNFKNCVDLRGKVELSNLPWLIKQASVVISNDSAPLHIASALNKPVIALFGPTDSSKYGPYPTNSRGRVISSNNGLMSGISTDQVSRALFKMIKQDDIQS